LWRLIVLLMLFPIPRRKEEKMDEQIELFEISHDDWPEFHLDFVH